MSSRRPTVGVIDGPLDPAQLPLEDHAIFVTGTATETPGAAHAHAMTSAIARDAPQSRFRSAVIFGPSLTVDPAVLARALTWMNQDSPDILCCSFGLRRLPPELTELFHQAAENSRVLVAAAPARGPVTYPAAIPGALAVQGDARCQVDEWSWLATPLADMGICVRSTIDPAIAGASIAAAHAAGIIANLIAGGAADRNAILTSLRKNAAYHGRERRT